MSNVLSSEGLDLIFRKGRTHSVWLDKPVDHACVAFYEHLGNVVNVVRFNGTLVGSSPVT